MSNAVEFKQIFKRFPGVNVLKNVSFSIKKGEVHALLGENGAGKTTLLNILHGVYTDYEGDILLNGQKAAFKNPNDAIIHGRLSKVHQEVNIVRDLTVGQNVTLGYEPAHAGWVNYRKLNNTVNGILQQLKCDFRSEDMADKLTAGQMQMIGIAKALFHKSSVISLDEPTASLTARETQALFEIIEELREAGITVIYVSHRLEEIFQICDRATILRDGEFVATLNVSEINREDLIHHMVGRNVNAVASRTRTDLVRDNVVLEVKGLCRQGVFSDIDFTLKQGEILGFFGLVGAGRTEVMRVLFGADKKTSGNVFFKGKPVNIRNTQDALKLGVGLLPEERKSQGFIKFTTNTDNATLSCLEKFTTNGFVDSAKRRKNYIQSVKNLNITPGDPDFLTQNMSGGNQQKVILARWLSTDVEVLIFDEPTKGIDVAAKAEIYKLMEQIAANGKSIIVISSELPEVMGISDWIIVMCEGRKTAELDKKDFQEHAILNYAMGGCHNA